MTVRNRRAASAGAALLAAAVALAGCAAPAPEPEDEPTSAGPSEAPGLPDPATCLIGDWEITQEQMQSFYDAVTAQAGDAPSFDVTGGTGLSFTGTSYRYTPDLVLEMDLDGTVGSGTITGSISGDYTVSDGIIATEHDESDIASEITVNGVTMDGSELIGELLAAHPINSAPYECTGDTVVIQFDTGFGRAPVELQPVG